jgi:stage II sporulation protein D
MGDVLSLFLENKEQALAIYTRVIERFGSLEITENAYFNRAMILYEQGRLIEARQGFAEYASLFSQGVRTGTALFMVDQIDGELQTPEREDEIAPNVEEPVAADRFIRVALASEPAIRMHVRGGGRLVAGGSRRDLAGESVECRVSGGKLLCNGVVLGSTVTVEPLQEVFTFKDRTYQGQAVMMVDQGKVLLVNRLPMEAYLRGVVPKEMMASWDDEALCSQAVAARTYALYLSGKSEDKPYDVAATTASQVYGGAGAATLKTDQAVARTAGQVLVFEGRPVLAYFHSHSGGMLEDPAKVWTTSMPYYIIKNDQISQQFHPVDWNARIAVDEVQKALIQNGFHVGPVRDMRIVETSPSGRWTRIKITTDTGAVEIKGNSLRIWLGAGRIKSTFGTLTRQGDAFVFKGQGFGHGVGLSQWGAQGMARAGRSYQEILTHYYPGTTISKIY